MNADFRESEGKMKKTFLSAMMIALCLSSAALVKHGRGTNGGQDSKANVTQATSAPFRDGLYLGKLAADRGTEPHVASGRWAAEADRILFAAGFQQGYQVERVQLASDANPKM
jgi:hypothetical protein